MRLAIIGLGYVGLPLAVEFAKKYPVIGFDINYTRIAELNQGLDTTLEISSEELNSVLSLSAPHGLTLTSDFHDLAEANCYIVSERKVAMIL